MIWNLGIGLLMISLTVIIHTAGLMGVTHVTARMIRHLHLHGQRRRMIAMITVVLGIFAVLTFEIWLWAACYEILRVVPDFSTALYFSTTTFATVGYGDVVPEQSWRLLAALEGINGFLLIGWSTAYLVAAGVRVGPFKSGEHF